MNRQLGYGHYSTLGCLESRGGGGFLPWEHENEECLLRVNLRKPRSFPTPLLDILPQVQLSDLWIPPTREPRGLGTSFTTTWASRALCPKSPSPLILRRMNSSLATPQGHLSPSPLFCGTVVTARRRPLEVRPFPERGLPRPRRTETAWVATVRLRPASGFVPGAPRRAGNPSLLSPELPAALATPRMSPQSG